MSRTELYKKTFGVRQFIIVMFCLTAVFVSNAQNSGDSISTRPQRDHSVLRERVEIKDTEVPDSLVLLPEQSAVILDTLAIDSLKPAFKYTFNPDPTRAVWLSALFPGLGQVYNRRYWKLPIVVGGFMGISYALTWNNRMLGDYTKAYRDLMDNDPNTNSYVDFFHSSVDVDAMDRAWLEKTFKAKKDFYRRNRDLSIICMVGMYLLCMVDAYVDASLSQFDISPDLSMHITPELIPSPNYSSLPSVAVQWALTF